MDATDQGEEAKLLCVDGLPVVHVEETGGGGGGVEVHGQGQGVPQGLLGGGGGKGALATGWFCNIVCCTQAGQIPKGHLCGDAG